MSEARNTPTRTMKRVGRIRNAVVALSVGSALALAAGLGLTGLGDAGAATPTTGATSSTSPSTSSRSSQATVSSGSSTTSHATSSGS